ncbi:phosphoserine phosphatase [Actinacidiphila yanglinensis]|uniref:Phosphoserine phosphatase n=1 Tax=Actinacidiphila yanglinensis TaxID=310779 RepID=A0A1H6A7L8_9ACTN|nr:HAD-IB family phosphatase [Actinacidiphila yanglinensis]SEG44728.1 phosphoserine phosphatase [Actinacidiphila yanglinensis]
MARLHIFDMDGTLLPGTSASMEIARRIDRVSEFRELDAALVHGEIDSYDYARRAYRMWSALTEHHVAGAFAEAPWLTGIREVWADITARGDHCAVISLSPDFFVTRLRTWGVHHARASVFPAFPFAPGAVLDPSGVLMPESKVAIADELCAHYGVGRADCVAYGDSLSDTKLFGVVPVSVAVNGDDHVSGLATHAYTGGDLREAYALVTDS